MRLVSLAAFASALFLAALGGACSSGTGSEAVSAVSAADKGGNGDDTSECDDDGEDNSAFLSSRAAQGLAIAPVPLNLAGKSSEDVTRIGYGSYLVNAIVNCGACHTFGNGYLAGGRSQPMANNGIPAPAGATVFSRNLTPDPTTGMTDLSEDEFVEILRTGKDVDNPGQRLLVMPWNILRWLSVGDIKAIYAYLQVIPPVHFAVPADVKRPALPPVPFPGNYNAGDVTRDLPKDTTCLGPNYERGMAVDAFANPGEGEDNHGNDELKSQKHAFARGSYLVNAVGICMDCHTKLPYFDLNTTKLATPALLSGGRYFNFPLAVQKANKESYILSADLMGATNGLFHLVTYDEFKNIITTGTHAFPTRPLKVPMSDSAAAYKNMVDDDLRAIYTFFTLGAARTGAGDKVIDGNYARWCANSADCHSDETCFADPVSKSNLCVGGACTTDLDCDQCMTCTAGHCKAATAIGCVGNGL
jgi:mono/diheme cytochrome c family protein